MSISHQILIVGGGAAGLAVASSLYKRNSTLDIAVVEPADKHYYQPGWTMVGAGVFDKTETYRDMNAVWPTGVKRIKSAVVSFEPDQNNVILKDDSTVGYTSLVVAPGLKLDWGAIKGLNDSLGQNGVTSNYRYDLAPSTWELVKKMDGQEAIFTQPGISKTTLGE